MNDDQRGGVRDNARYLRNVRPVDPEEIHEYVEGQPHPAAVRQVLRESAADLGLVERDDGTFVPVEEGPVAPDFAGVDALPEEHARRLENLLVEEYGPDWHRGESGDALRATIRRIKEDYYRGRDVEYDHDTALAYAIYHLPDYYAAVQYVLDSMAADGLLGRHLRVLDVGAGVGGPALGLADFLPDDALLEYHAVEPSAAADVLEQLLAGTGRNVDTTIHRTTAESFDPDGEYDLVLVANVLSELDAPAAVMGQYLDALAPHGSLVALAPADLRTATGLRETERAVEREHEVTVYGPEVRLWPDRRPTDRGWSFDVAPDLAVPAFQRRLDEACADHDDDEFLNVDVQYAHSVLRTDGRRATEFTPDADRVAPMAEMERHVTQRIDCVALKLSHSLAEDGNPLFRIGDGSQDEDHYAVLVNESVLNRDLRTAGYGDLLALENVLVLWNDDEAAYNLVVGEDTVVDLVATAPRSAGRRE